MFKDISMNFDIKTMANKPQVPNRGSMYMPPNDELRTTAHPKQKALKYFRLARTLGLGPATRIHIQFKVIDVNKTSSQKYPSPYSAHTMFIRTNWIVECQKSKHSNNFINKFTDKNFYKESTILPLNQNDIM